MKCLIVGTGDMAHALTHQYTQTIHATHKSRYELVIASPTRQFIPGSVFHDMAPFVDITDGLRDADIIVLAIPGKFLPSFVERYAEWMDTAKIVIDIHNNDHRSSNNTTASAEETFRKHDICWVKGLNDVGAVDLLSRSKSNNKNKPKTRISTCCNDPSTILQVTKNFLQDALGFEVIVVAHHGRSAKEQDSIGSEWKHAAYIALSLYAIFLTIYSVHYYVKWPYPMDPAGFPHGPQNKAVSSVAVGCFALSVLPGTVTRIIKAYRNDSLYVLNEKLVWALTIRKHVGLVGMFFLFVHAIMSLVDFSPAKYYWCMYASKDAETMDVVGEVSMMCAIYSLALYIIVALSSMPGISEAMNKAQWDFVFGPVCWMALALAHVHYCVIFFTKIRGTLYVYGGVPHATVIASILPWTAFILKFVQMIYCRIVSHRNGNSKKNDDRRSLSTTQHSGYSKRGSAAFSSGTFKNSSSSEHDSQEEVVQESGYVNDV